MRKMLILGMMFGLLLGTGSILGTDSPAMAEDDQPCSEPRWHNGVQMLVQDCEMWQGAVPVVAGFEGAASQKVVGELTSASGNWFTCQLAGASYQVPGTNYVNHWWAATMADNDKWGFVNEAYFAGGDNNEPDAKLASCSAAPAEGPVKEPAEEPVEYEWSDCIWGEAPDDYVIATFDSRDGNTYTLNCQNVRHIYEGHGFNESTIPCIDHVLTSYDYKGPSESDPRNDLFKISSQPVPFVPGNFINAFVVTDRTNLRVVTAFVELKTVELLLPYEGDLWDACVPVPTTA